MLGKLSFSRLKVAQNMNGLTQRQREILSFVVEFSNAQGFPPSVREIGGHFKIASSSTLEHLRALERKGYIRRVPSKSRCLEVIKNI